MPPPSCLNHYRPRPLTPEEAERYIMNSSGCNRFQLACPCGSNLFEIIHYSEYHENPCSPLYTLCKQCGKRELLFDSDLHGYDAMIGDSVLTKGTSEETVWACPKCHRSGRIILSFGYSTTEEDLENLSINGHVTDFFDGLMVFHVCAESGSLHSVAGYECA